MARQLIGKARAEAPAIDFVAQTETERNASTRVLEKLGFELTGAAEHDELGTVWEWRLTAAS